MCSELAMPQSQWIHASKRAHNVAALSQLPDSKVHGANMGPIWVLSAPDGPHGGPMNLAIREHILYNMHTALFCCGCIVGHSLIANTTKGKPCAQLLWYPQHNLILANRLYTKNPG